MFQSPVSNLSEITGLFIPCLLENLVLVLVALINLGIISSLGNVIVVGVGLVDPIGLIVQYVYIALGLASTILISQIRGAGREEDAKKCYVQAMGAIFLLSCALSALGLFFRMPLLRLLYPTAEPLALDCASDYLYGVFLTGPIYSLANVTCGMLRAYGRARQSLYVTMLVNLSILAVNSVTITLLGLDYHWLKLSITLSRVFTFILVYRYSFSRKHRTCDFEWRKNLRPDLKYIKKFFNIGVPFITENVLFYSGRLIVQMIAVQLGTAAATINTMTMNLMNFIQCTGASMATISVVIVGRAMGMGEVAWAKRYVRLFYVATSIFNAVMFAATLSAFRPITAILNAGAEIVPQLLINLCIIGVANVIVWPRGFLIANCLKSAGDIRFTTVTAIATMWLFRVLFAYLFAIRFRMGVLGITAAMVFEWAARAVIYSLRYRSAQGFARSLI